MCHATSQGSRRSCRFPNRGGGTCARLLVSPLAEAAGREERYLIVACTVITDVPEVVGPWPVALMAKVSPPLYLAFALYS